MNIQRYQWPVIVAASLHGALFLFSPEPKVRAGERPVVAEPLPPIPKESVLIVPVVDPDSEASSPAGAPQPSLLPEIVDLNPERSPFPIPQTERPQPEVTKLNTIPIGAVGPGPDVGAVSSGLITADKLDRVPRATAQLAPEYPHAMQQLGLAGTVLVQFDVGTDGRVTRAEAVRASRREFVEPALRAVRSWRFEPGLRKNRPVAFRMTVPIEFNLDS